MWRGGSRFGLSVAAPFVWWCPIDTPYLTEGSSGITYVVDRFKGWEHSGHVTLQRGERSRLADHAAEIL